VLTLLPTSDTAKAWLDMVPVDLSESHTQRAVEDLPHALGPCGRMGVLTNTRGVKLATYFWPRAVNAVSRGTVVVVHGHGSHAAWDWLHIATPGSPPSYDGSWVQALNNAGFSVAALDLIGHGRSAGARCYVHSFDHYCDDAELLGGIVQSGSAGLPGFTQPGLPCFFMAASLGGGVTVHMMHRHYQRTKEEGEKPLFSGAILLAPMLALDSVASTMVNQLLLAMASVINVVVPSAPLVGGGKDNPDPIIQQAFEQDPLTSKCKKTRVRNAIEYFNACKKLQKDLESSGCVCCFPFLVFHCQEDTWTECGGSQRLYDKSGSEDKTFKALPGDAHALTKFDGSADVLQEVLAWLGARAC